MTSPAGLTPVTEDKKAGRPSIFTEELAIAICERIADRESLRSICLDEDMPDRGTVFRWLRDDAAFRHQYTCAREMQADALFEETLEIADGAGVNVKRDKLRVDTRKWMAGKLAPKKYGERHLHEHSGPDGGPIQTETKVSVQRDLAALFERGPDGSAEEAGDDGSGETPEDAPRGD